MVRLMKRYTPRVPGVLVALILMTVIVAVFSLDQKGVAVLGTLPSGLPSLTVPDIPLADYLPRRRPELFARNHHELY